MLTKIDSSNILQHYEPKRDIFLHWAIIDEEIKRFCNNSNPRVFEFIFGDDGERLWKHFRIDCDNSFQKFRTYLVQEQLNNLLVTLLVNKEMLYML